MIVDVFLIAKKFNTLLQNGCFFTTWGMILNHCAFLFYTGQRYQIKHL